MHKAAHPPLQSAMGLAREIRRKIQWASAAQLLYAITLELAPNQARPAECEFHDVII